MKNGALYLIKFYQTIISPFLKILLGVPAICRYNPTCSEYTRQMIEKYGMIRGITLGVRRLSTCHPFRKGKG